ncbi:PHP domain-containing protein [Candidatus Peregrinibacteria bacterium]|nr:PHP domain-containing protein [Candidatus Peregrinibacteria bacterium]
MKKFKVQLHCHTKSDPDDWLFHNDVKLINYAAACQYDVLAITCHNKIVHTKELEKYADKKHILLIPGIEKNISNKHVLVINAHDDISKADDFNELRLYKKEHPGSLIIAAHPYHPTPYSLKNELETNIDLFDGIEWSSFYTPMFKLNNKAMEIAEKYKKPLVGTSDNHALKYLNLTYSYVFAQEKSKNAIIDAIKQGHLKIHTQPMNFVNLFLMTLRLTALEQIKKYLLKPVKRRRNKV